MTLWIVPDWGLLLPYKTVEHEQKVVEGDNGFVVSTISDHFTHALQVKY